MHSHGSPTYTCPDRRRPSMACAIRCANSSRRASAARHDRWNPQRHRARKRRSGHGTRGSDSGVVACQGFDRVPAFVSRDLTTSAARCAPTSEEEGPDPHAGSTGSGGRRSSPPDTATVVARVQPGDVRWRQGRSPGFTRAANAASTAVALREVELWATEPGTADTARRPPRASASAVTL